MLLGCDGLNDLNVWSPGRRWQYLKCLGSMAFLEEVCQWVCVLRITKPMSRPDFLSLLMNQDVVLSD